MRKITKGLEPQELTAWKRQYPNSRYSDLADNAEGQAIRQAIKRETCKEQFGLCAYCCKTINEASCVNEHVQAQKLAPNRTLDFNNIVASCTTKGRCDNTHGSQPLPLTPLMDECETELRFRASGKVDGLTQRATDSIHVLGLDTRAIREERRQQLDNLMFYEPMISWGIVDINENELQLLVDVYDTQTIHAALSELQQPDGEGRLLEYSPVLINIFRQFLVPKLEN